MYKHTVTFVDFCRKELSFQLGSSYGYQSLSVCILDCVYSLRAKYFSTTVPVIERYAAAYMGNNRFAAGNTVTDLVANIESVGPQKFAADILKNMQQSGGI